MGFSIGDVIGGLGDTYENFMTGKSGPGKYIPTPQNVYREERNLFFGGHPDTLTGWKDNPAISAKALINDPRPAVGIRGALAAQPEQDLPPGPASTGPLLGHQLSQIDPTMSRADLDAYERAFEARRLALGDDAAKQWAATVVANKLDETAPGGMGSLESQITKQVNALLGPAPTPLNALQLQTLAGNVVAPIQSQAISNINNAAEMARQAGAPAEVVAQYQAMGTNVANAFAQQALAFPQLSQLNQTYARSVDAQELRNELARQMMANMAAPSGSSSDLNNVIQQTAPNS